MGGRVPDRKTARKISPQKKAALPKAFLLSEDQQRAVDLAVEGKNVFFTGELEAGVHTGGGGRWAMGKRGQQQSGPDIL